MQTHPHAPSLSLSRVRSSIGAGFRAALLAAPIGAMAATSCSEGGAGGAPATAAGGGEPAEWTARVELVPSPSGPDSSDPQVTTSDRGVLLSWVEQAPAGRTSTLKFAERGSSGWSAPVTVASGEDWFVSYADPPTVMRLSDGTLVASWLVLTDILKEATELHLSYSRDEGKTWSQSFLPHHDRTTSQHAFASLFELPGRALGLLWLDGRGEAMGVRYTTFDASWKQTEDIGVDAKACECCGTSVAMAADGPVAVFRDRTDAEIRDIVVSRLERGAWSAAVPVHADGWQVDYCPINGPMVSARGRQAAVAWFTVKSDQGQSYAAFSSDSGRTWGEPIRLDERGSTGRVDIELLDDGSAVATWVEVVDGRGELRMRRLQVSGLKSPAVSVAGVPGGSSSGYPRFARRDKDLVFAWTETAVPAGGSEGTLSVHTAIAHLP